MVNKSPTILLLLLSFNFSFALTAPNKTAQHYKKIKRVEAIIHQHIRAFEADKSYNATYAKDFASTIRNPFTKLPPESYSDLVKQGINIEALSQYKARYIMGTLAGSKAIDIINKDPKTILVVGSGTITHDGIYSLGPIVLTGKTHIMGDIYSPKLVWLGLNTTLSSTAIGLPLVFSEEKSSHHNLGATPYSVREEINATIAFLKKHNHIKNALDKSKTTRNPLLTLSAKQQQHLRQEKIDINTLKKYTALKVSQSYETIMNTDPHTLLVLDENLSSSSIYSLGPIISYASLDSIDSLLSTSMIWSFTKPRSSQSSNDIKGSPLIFNP